MRFLMTALLLTLSASSVAQPPKADSRAPSVANAAAKLDCVNSRVRHADQLGSTRPRRLDELPAGKLYLSVVREVDGCQELALASEERGRAGSRR